jgi:hypothetical protein
MILALVLAGGQASLSPTRPEYEPDVILVIKEGLPWSRGVRGKFMTFS